MTVNIPFLASNLSGVIQDGLLERRFYEALRPLLLWRSLFEQKQHSGRIGEIVQMTRPGLITPDDETTAAITAGQDPGVVTRAIERFTSQPKSFGKSINIDLPASYEAQASLFLDDLAKMAFHAAQTMGRIARNKTLQAYGGGNTFATADGAATTAVPVKDCAGFDTVLDANGIPQPVSSTNKLACTLGGTAVNVIAVSASSGAGTVTLDANATFSKWDALVRGDAPKVFRCNNRATDHLIVAGDTAIMQVFRDAHAYLVGQNVPGMDGSLDGPHGCFVTPDVENALLADPEFHDAIRGQGQAGAFVSGVIGTFGGVTFVRQNEMVKLAADSDYQSTIHRCFMFGQATGIETYIPEPEFATEARPEGIATANHYKSPIDRAGVMTSIIRAPLDALGRRLVASWVANCDYTLPTDALGQNGTARHRRGAVIHVAGPA